MEKNRKGTKKKKIGLIIFLVIMLTIGIVAGVFAYRVEQNGGGLKGLVITIMEPTEEKAVELDTFYCVLLGQSQNLTDTIMLVAYNPAQQKASLLSVPRDTYVGTNRNTASPWDKINALCQYHHPEKTVAAVSRVTGIDVEKYILIDTKALKEAVDLIGGVYFDVPIDMYYTDEEQGLYIDLKQGYQYLDGNKAEQVVRFRHNNDGTSYPASYGREDVGRTRTQREFLMAVAEQMLKIENIVKIREFLDIFYENVKTNIELSEMLDYLPYLVSYDVDTLKSGIVPGNPEWMNGYSMYVHNSEETAEMVEELFGSIDIAEDSPTIEILNGTGDSNINDKLSHILKTYGYRVISASNTTETARTVIINRTNDSENMDKIRKIVGAGVKTQGENNNGAEITIVLGKDYIKE